MIEVTITNENVEIRSKEPLDTRRIRDAIPGVTWNHLDAWLIPLTPRSVLSLRHYLTDLMREGVPVYVPADVAPQLTRVADAPRKPDVVREKDRIVFTFEFHQKYQNLMMMLGAHARKDGSWTLPWSSVDEVVRSLEGSPDIDLLMSDELLNVEQKPIPGFDGTLASLRRVSPNILDFVASNPPIPMGMRKKNSKKKDERTFAERLNTFGIRSLYDLITLFPLRYLDRTQPSSIKDLNEGDDAVIVGTIHSISAYDPQRRMTRVVVEDETRHRISATFFSQPWVNKKFRAGQRVILSGTFGYWRPKRGNPVTQMSNPLLDHLLEAEDSGGVIPIYPQSDVNGIASSHLTRTIEELLRRLSEVKEPLPNDSSDISLDDAIRAMHQPMSMGQKKLARQRLVDDELLLLQMHILSNKADFDKLEGIVQPLTRAGLVGKYVEDLPYELTGAQKRALNELAVDSESPTPMHRLLQGDVSSGKTTIAHALVLNAVDNGHQGAILAPTEILAEQLFSGLVEAMPDLTVEFLGSKVTGKKREAILERIASGESNVIVGTHALLVENVIFHDLSAIVVDEQHRFGAAQRSLMRQKREDGKTPDMLVMTATPIPRTGAMVIYGDLDMSVLDELPPGRVPIETSWVQIPAEESVNDWTLKVWDDIRQQVSEGRQAYVVASLVEDSDKIAAASTEEAFLALQSGPLNGLRLGKVHGRMPRKEREKVMQDFAAGNVDVLVATTVIEVGVNVPNATVMAVLDAGRFGIAQLHQIRGRVGRASWQSRCYLIGDTGTPDGRQRMEALVASTDGFYLAEKDLEIRGEGALFGTRQSGESDLMLASLREDLPRLEVMREKAKEIIAQGGSDYDTLMWMVNAQYQDKEIAS